MSTRREDLAWAAGFFDGEGCIYFKVLDNRYKTLQMSLSISQNAFKGEPLDKWYRIFKVGGFSDSNMGRGNENPISTWRTAKFEHIQYIISSIWFMLGEVKRNQYTRMMKTYLDTKPWIDKRGRPLSV